MGVWQTARDWAMVAARHNVRPMNPNTIVVFDSYYMTSASVMAFKAANVMFMGLVKRSNFANLCAMVDKNVTETGEWAGVHNPDAGLTLVHR